MTDFTQYHERLAAINAEVAQRFPGDPDSRQPVHVVFGGANLYKPGAARKLGDLALRSLDQWASTEAEFADVFALPADLAGTIYQRVRQKLIDEPIEDQRIDFEDGYGNRADDVEDADAVRAAQALAAGMAAGDLPPFVGFRIKSLSDECRERSLQTLDRFISSLLEASSGQLPENFVINLPKITHQSQIEIFVEALTLVERQYGLTAGALKFEIMVETPQAIFDEKGGNPLREWLHAADGRCVTAHFGTYDYTASVGVSAAHQSHTHPAADFARDQMQVALAGTGVFLSDGATTVMPIAPHRGQTTPEQDAENRAAIHAAWKLHFDNISSSLRQGFYQGWDLNPAQFPARYAAVYHFFLSALDDSSRRLNSFLGKAAQATLTGNEFDDAATGQGLLNFFLRGLACGAITTDEVLKTGITLDELKSRSFRYIVAARSAAG